MHDRLSPEYEAKWTEEFRELLAKNRHVAVCSTGQVWFERAGLQMPEDFETWDDEKLVEAVVSARRRAYEKPVHVGFTPDEELHRAHLAMQNALWGLYAIGEQPSATLLDARALLERAIDEMG